MFTRKKKKSASRRKPFNEKHIIGFLFGVTGFLTIFLGGLLFFYYKLNIPDISSVAHYLPPQASLIYDRNLKVVDRIYIENRVVVPLDEMSPLLPQAFVAAEDGRFFEHPGLDSVSVLRALINNLRSGRKSQGGSTITQQVAKGLLLTPEKTYLRKFKEAILAYRIDAHLTKNEILYIYLNQIYLGSGAYGVEAASLTYFNKRAMNLSLGEIAVLAGLPQAPSRYSPLDHFKRARERQRYVLNRMAADGYISDSEARTAYAAELRLKPFVGMKRSPNGYYLQIVRKRAEQMLGVPLEKAGVRIFTNLDQRQQKNGLQVLNESAGIVAKQQKSVGVRSGAPEAALVAMEACTGEVRALAGGTDFGRTEFNRAVQARRPAGSVFKPLVYSVALEKGYAPQSRIKDEPLSIRGRDGRMWRPRNFDNQYRGVTTLEDALVNSINMPAIEVLQKIGTKPVHTYARSAGITSELPNDLSLALGSADVSVLEMTAAYSPIVCNGSYSKPIFINRIETAGGNEIYRYKPSSAQVLDSRVSKVMKDMLEKTISSGTGKRAAGLSGRSGGKTGTSNDNRDAWFVGYHNELLAGVWMGYDRNQSLGRNNNGGSLAAPTWKAFMVKRSR